MNGSRPIQRSADKHALAPFAHGMTRWLAGETGCQGLRKQIEQRESRSTGTLLAKFAGSWWLGHRA